MRKFCKNEKMSLDEFADKFRLRNPYVPEQFYGKLAKFETLLSNKKERLKKRKNVLTRRLILEHWQVVIRPGPKLSKIKPE